MKNTFFLPFCLCLFSTLAQAQLGSPLVTSDPDSNAFMGEGMSEAALLRLWSQGDVAGDKGTPWRLPQKALDDCMDASRDLITTAISHTPAWRFKSAPGQSNLNTLGDPVRFRFLYGNNQFALSATEDRKLADIARVMQHPRVIERRFLLAGFANFTNTAQASKKVSCQRAALVRERLIALGVAPQRLAVFGFGEDENHFLPGTEGKDPRNRRLDIYRLAR
jgi:outer membrane protein OmpA-like peptidoglycan-associated protein